ncbi:hypothetical protein [Megasphaera sp. UBA4382]|uniref:hypothetical protein n=1 Tax=Megasphaera sp. UBA4382 TaxID=1946850 RepID=UPI0025BC1776|nr:hypothetical protein [Megasphaera sp. UBA4382]
MKFGKYLPQVSRSDWGNERYIFQFENGYGASVIRNHLSYGGPEGFYELAVLKDGKINYRTPITNDVIGWLDKNDVADTLKQIEEL